MAGTVDKQQPDRQPETWNTPEAIARHRAMTPAERVKLAAELSRQAVKLSQARRVDGK